MNAHSRCITFMLLLVFCTNNDLLSQKGKESGLKKKTYILQVPPFIEHGRIQADTRSTKDSSTVSFVFTFFPGSPHYLLDAGFSLNMKKQTVNLSLTQSKHLNMYQLMDSLKLNGWAFFRQSLFYTQLPGDTKDAYRPTIGYYIHMDYKDDDN